MNYFQPKLWIAMTATPDKRDDYVAGRNIYEIFNCQISYEIRFRQVKEESMLCTFHCFCNSDVLLLSDRQISAKNISERDFNMITGDERVRHIIELANYFGYSGNKVK